MNSKMCHSPFSLISVKDDINSGRDNAKSVQRSSQELIENCPAPERDNQVSHKDQRKNNI